DRLGVLASVDGQGLDADLRSSVVVVAAIFGHLKSALFLGLASGGRVAGQVIDQIDLGQQPAEVVVLGHQHDLGVVEDPLEQGDAGVGGDGRVVALDQLDDRRVE